MNELSDVIRSATKAIERSYFHLRIDGGDPVYRERVYCYELYHQMRLYWPQDCQFYLNGEIDKAAHPILRALGADHAKPDLLVHRPGYMSGNDTIIEVKKADAPRVGIRKDLSTLHLFLRKVRYQRAIYLFFGSAAAESLVERVRTIADKLAELEPIEIWLHHCVGQPAYHHFTIEKRRGHALRVE